MGIQLSDEEVWDFVGRSHTGILTTLRRDGRAVPLPLWFASFDGAVWFTTPAKSRKVARIRRDPRASFLVEGGLAWRELKAVMMDGTVAIVEEESAIEHVGRALDDKYRAFRPDLGRAPDATRKHYTSGSATLRFTPRSWISWDNAKIRFARPEKTA
ncbi:MAG: pyridoxamine 5'-phosphate oxidase family protein [Candidatus Binatia bacterium]